MRIPATAAILMVSAALAAGAEDLTITLPDAVEKAIAENLNLQKSAIDLATQKRAADNLWAPFMPSFSAGVSGSYTTSLLEPPDPPADPTLSASLGVSLRLASDLPFTLRTLRANYAAGRADYETTKRQLAIQVTKTFYSLVADAENIALLQKKLTAAENQADKDATAYKNGLLSDLNRQRSDLAVANAKLSLKRSETNYQSALIEFLISLGIEPDPTRSVTLEGDMNIKKLALDPIKLVNRYIDSRSDVVKAHMTIENLKAAKNQKIWAPVVSLSGTWTGKQPLYPTETEKTGALSSSSAQKNKFTDSLSLSLGVSIPIDTFIPNTTQNQSLKSAAADIAKAEIDLKNTRQTARQEIFSLVASLNNTWESIEIAQQTVTLAELTYNSTVTAFNQGTTDRLTLESQRNALSESRQNLLTGELQYLNGMLDLAGALNITLADLERLASQ